VQGHAVKVDEAGLVDLEVAQLVVAAVGELLVVAEVVAAVLVADIVPVAAVP